MLEGHRYGIVTAWPAVASPASAAGAAGNLLVKKVKRVVAAWWYGAAIPGGKQRTASWAPVQRPDGASKAAVRNVAGTEAGHTGV
jgi:hypothetical protein